MAEFSAGLLAWQEERFVIPLAIPPLTVKNRAVRSFGHVRLFGCIRYVAYSDEYIIDHFHFLDI